MENDFLKKKYNLHNASETDAAAKRTEIRSGEKVPQNPEDQIQNYLNRFTEILEREDSAKRGRGIEALKEVLHGKFIIKPEAVPETAFLLEQRIAREQGHGTVEITEDFKEKKIAEIINNQTKSLDKWVNYLSSPDATYPDWAKYWAFRSMLEMGKLQKEEDKSGKETVRFQKRTKDTITSFPPLNPRALAMTIGVLRSSLDEKQKPKKERQLIENKSVKLNEQDFQKLVSAEDFSKIYAQFLLEMPEYSTEGLQEIRGKWIKYEQGSDPTPLVQSLEGHPLEWCTANFDTAESQLQGGDFYVYYSFNENGEPTIPRVAIRMEGGKIGEVRGIAPDQNIDPYIAPVIEEKFKEFGSEGDVYKKKSSDMKLLTEIENKDKNNEQLTKDELVFLYEFNAPIEGFGYERDPRIGELKWRRNKNEDMIIIFECNKEQIAHNISEIKEGTKAYVGKLEPGIFDKIQQYNIEHIYTSFPEGRIRKETIEIGGKNARELLDEMRDKNFNFDGQTEEVIKSKYFKTREKSELETLVRLKVSDLGFGIYDNPTTDKIYKRIKQLGLDLCSAESGLYYGLKYPNHLTNGGFYVGMDLIPDVNHPFEYCTINLLQEFDCLWLRSARISLNTEWSLYDAEDSENDKDFEFIFRLSPLSNKDLN